MPGQNLPSAHPPFKSMIAPAEFKIIIPEKFNRISCTFLLIISWYGIFVFSLGRYTASASENFLMIFLSESLSSRNSTSQSHSTRNSHGSLPNKFASFMESQKSIVWQGYTSCLSLSWHPSTLIRLFFAPCPYPLKDYPLLCHIKVNLA